MDRKKKMPEDVREYFVKMGRKGGKIGGKASLVTMTSEERRARALQAAKARWSKKKDPSRHA